MVSRPKLLILDDEPDFLEVCQQMLAALPSRPEVLTATSGSRAIALLESEPFSLLLTDLRMPNMDGFQVLAIVRRRFPALRIVVMTGALEEQFRARAYAMGIDLFVEKPKSPKETQVFLDCVESMLERDTRPVGFRGVQQKSLVDIVQMECLTQSSAVLKITSGPSVGFIWLKAGEIIDAATGVVASEKAFKQILSWKVGNFELLPAEPEHVRTIYASAQGLLLDTAQALDEASAVAPEPETPQGEPLPILARLGRTKGVEYLVSREENGTIDRWLCENPTEVAGFAQQVLNEFTALGETLKAGSPVRVEGYGRQQHLAIAVTPERTAIVAGLNRSLVAEQVRVAIQQLLIKWDS